MLAAAASASRQLLQRDAIPSISGAGNPVRSLLTASGIAINYSIRNTRSYGYNYSYGYGISYNNRQSRSCPSLIFSIKGFLSDSSSSSSSSSSLHGRVTRPYLPLPSSTVDGRVLFSTSAKSGDGSQNQKIASTVAKSPLSEQVADVKILRTLASYLWMKDNPEFRSRVVAALFLLVGAKAMLVLLLQIQLRWRFLQHQWQC